MNIFLFLELAIILQNMNNEQSSFEIYREMIAGSNQEIRMIPINGGDFSMGSPQGEKNRRTDEGPIHPVRVDDFWMGEMESVGMFMNYF